MSGSSPTLDIRRKGAVVRLKKLTLLLVALLVAGSLGAQPGPSTTTAEVVAWNLAGYDPIPATRVEEFAEAVALLDPEVLALVEVNPDCTASDVVVEMGERGACYRRTVLPQSAHQNIAVLHKCDVEVTNPRLIPGSDSGSSRLRKALAVDVRMGEFDFILVTVHLKASRGWKPQTTRTKQARAIASFIESATQGAEKDVLVVGDYNMIPGEDGENFTALNPGTHLRFVTSELGPGAFSHIKGDGSPGNLLDGFAISRQHTGEYVAGSLEIVRLEQQLGISLRRFRERLADHLPVLARFRIDQDDD